MSKYLFTKTSWDVPLIQKVWTTLDRINKEKYGFSYNQPQMEVVTFDQMLYLYSTNGMPVMYPHWSFGAEHSRLIDNYRNGDKHMALEMIINTDPPIAYLMENNSAAAQTMVLAHACVGHSAVFKNNYLFKQWTRPGSIVSYLNFAKSYVEEMNAVHGPNEVATLIDAIRSLENFGVFHYKRPNHSKKKVQEKVRNYFQTAQREALKKNVKVGYDEVQDWYQVEGQYPQENLLYFIEKNSLTLKPWQKELVRIISTIQQYFYPQIQTKIINEGFATYCGYEFCKDLYEQGYITDAAYMEILELHTAVIRQAHYNQQGYPLTQLNPYKIGYEIFRDFHDTHTGTPYKDIQDIITNYRDESFLRQYLSDSVMKKLKLFAFSLAEDSDNPSYAEGLITATAGNQEELRKQYSDLLLYENYSPRLEIMSMDKEKRIVELAYRMFKDREVTFDDEDGKLVQMFFEELSGYVVVPRYIKEMDNV